MKKVILVLCVLLAVTALSANAKMKFIHNYDEFSCEDWREHALEMNTRITNFRDLYMLEVLYEEWDDETWVYDMKHIYTYDGNAYWIEILILMWVEGDWQNSQRQVMINNAEGYPVEMLWQIWDPITETWMDAALVSYTWDANWNITGMLVQMWWGDSLLNSGRYTMTYNADNNPIYVLHEDWDLPDGTEWENDDQEFYTYDGLFLEEILEENWENDSEWIWAIKHTYTLAGNYHPASSLRQNWNNIEWVNVRNSEHTYDGDWNEIQDFEQEWDNDVWVNFQDKYFTYEDGYMIERLTYDWQQDREWINGSRHTMTYGVLDAENNSISYSSDITLSNYPNPFNPTTTISFNLTAKDAKNAKLEIYNVKGQKVKDLSPSLCHTELYPLGRTVEVRGEKQYSVTWNGTDDNNNPVSSGIYFYKLQTANFEKTRKMILMK